jgi:menaquinone-dependent protoporphyrinogen oxidase
MSKVLILYATNYGQTRTIAMKIAERFHDRGVQTDILDAKYTDQLPAPDGYDAIVIGSRVELGKHASTIVAYLREHRQAIERMPTAFFSVSMAASTPSAGPDPNGYMTTMFEDLGWKPTIFAAVAGALPYRRYNWFLRFIMKRISKSAGHETDTTRNHVFTDWAAVDAFAERVIALLPTQVTARQQG